jgi:hypothetical protein
MPRCCLGRAGTRQFKICGDAGGSESGSCRSAQATPQECRQGKSAEALQVECPGSTESMWLSTIATTVALVSNRDEPSRLRRRAAVGCSPPSVILLYTVEREAFRRLLIGLELLHRLLKCQSRILYCLQTKPDESPNVVGPERHASPTTPSGSHAHGLGAILSPTRGQPGPSKRKCQIPSR